MTDKSLTPASGGSPDPAIQRMRDHRQDYKAAMVKLWATGLSSFGSIWRTDYGEVGEMVFNAWARSLCRTFEPETISEGGSQILSTWKNSFPPALGELRGALSQEARTRAQGGPIPEALPDQSNRDELREIAERELDQMYQILGVPKPTHDQLERRRKK
jgi:hypothetical protein